MTDNIIVVNTTNSTTVVNNSTDSMVVNGTDNIVKIENVNPIVKVENTNPIIKIISPGPQGPIGPQGPPGPAGVGSEFIRWMYTNSSTSFSVDFSNTTYIAADTSTGTMVITLPIASAISGPTFNQGWAIYIKSTTSSSLYNTLTVVTQSGQQIEGYGTSYTFLPLEGEAFLSTGSGYILLFKGRVGGVDTFFSTFYGGV